MTDKTTAEIIEGVLDLLNSPEKWCKHRLHQVTPEGVEQYCLLGAINMVAAGVTSAWSREAHHADVIRLLDLLAREKGYIADWRPEIGNAEHLVKFNNAPETEYEDLRLFLKEALERVA